MMIISKAEPTKRYVGRAKMFPDSRRPRRFPTMMSITAMTPIHTRQSSKPGNAEISCSTADVVETATVIT